VGTNYYSTFQNAYPVAANGSVIQEQAQVFTGDVTFDRNVSVTLQGGYDCNYTVNPDSTTHSGALTISNGTVNISNVVIQ
jgi:hypothetical protein